jgi:hypothetical protein
MSNQYPEEDSSTMNIGEVTCINEVFCNKSVLCGKLVVFGSSIIVNRVIVTTNYIIASDSDDYIVMADTTTGPLTITLPTIYPPNKLTVGRIINIIDSGGNSSKNNITISGDAAISGKSSIVISRNYNNVSLVSSDTAWFIY